MPATVLDEPAVGVTPAPVERIVITGIGVISSVGEGVDEFREALRDGVSGAAPITAFDTTGYDRELACEVPRASDATSPDGRAAQFAVGAATQAIADAGLTAEQLRPLRGAVAVGTTDGESQDIDELVRLEVLHGVGDDGADRLRSRVQPFRLSTAVARSLGLSDVDVATIATACAAGNYAIGYGFEALRSGEAQYALVGGADALCRKTFTGFYRLGTITPDVCRPFDADRQGILTGEGSCVLHLETESAARARGARIYAEVLGYGLSCDASHPVAPDVTGIARCIESALDGSGVTPADVDLVSAHGTGTRANDVTECAALGRVFGEKVPTTVSIKSMLGHAMGAASALGAAACAIAIESGFAPPTINHRQTDEDCPVDCVPNESRAADLQVVVNDGLAFGGNNAVVVLGRPRVEEEQTDAT
ncbi:MULTISPECIES: beta-ketoacyl-[acyl-carrier-protein] synthase family protein [Isoptericola]|uniref:beta-ketoacyl-[acyl-carrier-protein] synthase family protein n=1 Tax=Isoptericola TaxID=254250 RepID=UPI00383B6989